MKFVLKLDKGLFGSWEVKC